MESGQIILKLRESLEKDFGDYGRTQYIIEKLEKEERLPKSDHLYIYRMVKLCGPIMEDAIPEEATENVLPEDLARCHHCDLEIRLDKKSVRRNDSWFHDKCFKKIPTVKTERSQKRETAEKGAKQQQPIRVIQARRSYPQMAYSGGLLASLVGTTYFFAGDVIATVVGVCGSALYFATFKNQVAQNKKERSSLVKTGIQGFDSTLSAGLKKNSSVAVSGPPGSGKTTFGLQFIYSGAKEFNEPGAYISLSQSTDEIKNDCKSFGWDMEEMVAKGKVILADLRPFKVKDEAEVGRDDSLYRGERMPFEHLTKFVLNSIKKINAKRIVVDSISMLEMQYSDKFRTRQGMQKMIQTFENFGVTSLLISEDAGDDGIPLEWVVTSGIIRLDNQVIDGKMKRTIKITKMRGMQHSEHSHPLELGSNGLYVHEN